MKIRNPKQVPMTKARNSKPGRGWGGPRMPAVLNIGIGDFEMVLNFEIRISDFSLLGR